MAQTYKRPAHLFVSDTNGALYDLRRADWSGHPPLRASYERHHPVINTVAQLKATLRHGATTSLGGYPLYFLASDGEALSFAAVRAELASVMASIATKARDGWRVVACDVNWEDGALFCAHTNERIPSAYAEPEEESGI